MTFDGCSDVPDAFDPYTAHYIKPAWHSKIVIQPAPIESRVYGKPMTGGDCAVWTSGTNGKGHARAWINGEMWYLHRWTYMCQNNVWIPTDVHIDHLCRVRPCINPFHHDLATPLENFQRGDGPKFTFKTLRAKIAETMDELPF